MSNTRELLKTIEEQKGQLQRFESRLRDLVAAYKGVQKEKEALESILKSQVKNATEDVSDSRSKEFLNPLEEQVATLTRALSTVTEEKSRIEAGFQADNRKLKQHSRELEKSLIANEEKLNSLKTTFEKELTEMKCRIRNQQLEREKEQSDHAAMIRELQKLLSSERRAKEELEVQVEEMSLAAVSSHNQLETNHKYFTRIKELSKEVDLLRTQLETAQQKALQPQPMLITLQQEMMEMKAQHGAAVQQEQSRANEAEAKLRETARMSEDRVANLETRLSELSDMIGNYDRQRQQDQQVILKLKERVTQLDLENTALAREATKQIDRAPSSPPILETKDEEHDDCNLDVHALMSKILRMKGMLKLANERSQNPIDLQTFFQETQLVLENNKSDHVACREELSRLKDEFERYKTRAQSILKSKNLKDNATPREVNSMHDQIMEFRERIKTLMAEKERSDKIYGESVAELRSALTEQRTKHRQELTRAEASYNAKIGELEVEMSKLRERIMAILEDKDHEIRMLKLSLYRSPETDAFDQWSAGQRDSESEEEIKSAMREEQMAEDLSLSLVSGPGETRLLHYAHEISRRDVEISNLRKVKHQLEVSLRDLQEAFQNKEDVLQGEKSELKSEVKRLQRSFSREGANLEYLKNVVLNYMMSVDPQGRQHMLNAIAAILKFTSKELESVKSYNSSWWWNTPIK